MLTVHIVALLLDAGFFEFVRRLPEAKAHPLRVTELVATVASRERTPAERREAERELVWHHPREVLPAVHAALERAKANGEVTVPGYTFSAQPVNPDSPGLGLRRVWSDFMSGYRVVRWLPLKDWGRSIGAYVEYIGPAWRKAAVGVALAKLLAEAKTDDTRSDLIAEMRGMNYHPVAERPLAAIFRDWESVEQTNAAEILVEHHPAKYASEVIDRVANVKLHAYPRQQYLAAITSLGYDGLPPAERERFVRAGFTLVGETRAYFTASYMGNFVGVRFQPDSSDQRYRDSDGNLRDKFEDATVRAALAWWARNGRESD